MGNKIFAPKGTKDIYGKDIYLWEKIESEVKRICKEFNFKQIITPMFEHLSVFDRGVGESTDIVSKEMYTLNHRGDEVFALKPEGTSSVIRAYIEHGLNNEITPTKLFYITPCFRSERPQKGRQRQFHQFGVEALGSSSPMIDAEVILLASTFFKRLKVDKAINLKLNSVGCPMCRSEYYKALREFFKGKEDKLCEDCKIRLEKNPMRMLDCKRETCKSLMNGVPLMKDYLCDDCKEHQEKLLNYLDILDIKYEIDYKIVRGLDYYTQTAFEFVSDSLGAQATVCGGGRYNSLVEMLGGKDSAGIGFGLGIERLILLIEAENPDLLNLEDDDIDVYIAPLGEKAKEIALKYLKILIEKGLSVQTDCMDKSLKAQMKYANKINAKKVLILGEDEIENEYFTIRDMSTKEQKQIKFEDIIKYMIGE